MTSQNRTPITRMGLQIPLFTYPGVGSDTMFDTVAGIAKAGEAAGFDSLWVMDHFYQLPGLGQPEEPMFEAYSLLTALAAVTERVKLGAMVGGVTYRNPAFLAKTVTGLDVISKGRAIWGIGAGWFELEHDAYGYEFGTFTDRFEKLEEALQIAKSMFVNDTTTFEGKWFRVKDAYNVPRPVQAGGPPVLIGGSGEKKTLRMVAQYGDACNVFGNPQQVRKLMGVLDEHCERLGRDPREITRTRLGTLVVGKTYEEALGRIAKRYGVSSLDDLKGERMERMKSMMIIGDRDTVGEEVSNLLDAGLDGLIFNLPEAHDLETVALAGEFLRPLLKQG
jgi:F420-dependent oxidoreductase-like protein